jgi:hypothetical protein
MRKIVTYYCTSFSIAAMLGGDLTLCKSRFFTVQAVSESKLNSRGVHVNHAPVLQPIFPIDLTWGGLGGIREFPVF